MSPAMAPPEAYERFFVVHLTLPPGGALEDLLVVMRGPDGDEVATFMARAIGELLGGFDEVKAFALPQSFDDFGGANRWALEVVETLFSYGTFAFIKPYVPPLPEPDLGWRQ